jgi:acetyl-CoA acetyltransferase
VLRAVVERNGVDPALVEDVIMGCVMQVGEQGINVGRNAALAAGFPETVCGTSVDRQ